VKAVLQRVSGASVSAPGETAQSIGAGLAVMLGVAAGDGVEQAKMLASKIVRLRIFSDAGGKLNLSLIDTGFGVLAVPNFTLCADCRRGRRPDFGEAAKPDEARELFGLFCALLREEGAAQVKTGFFGADMSVEIHADGPVTLTLDTSQLSLPRR
jgi:D-tyrosyl-tRNA(Tyr) deacylase